MKKIWKDIPEYEGLYQVSNSGEVKRTAAGQRTQVGRLLKQCRRGRNNYKYLCVCLYKNGTKKMWQIHQLVAAAFLGPHKDMIVRHIDGNRFNNASTNLAYGTQKTNIQDRTRHGNTIRGSRQWKSKLSEQNVKNIRVLYRSGKFTQTELASFFGVSQSAVWNIVTNKTWNHVK